MDNRFKTTAFDVSFEFYLCDECLICHWINLVRSGEDVCEQCGCETKLQIFGDFDSYREYRANLTQWSIGKTDEEIDAAVSQQKMMVGVEFL